MERMYIPRYLMYVLAIRFYCIFPNLYAAECIVTFIWNVIPAALFLQGMNDCLKTTGTIPCSNILLNSVHLVYTWYFSFHPTLTCFHSFFALPLTPVLPPSLWKWLRTRTLQYLIPHHKRRIFFMCPVQ